MKAEEIPSEQDDQVPTEYIERVDGLADFSPIRELHRTFALELPTLECLRQLACLTRLTETGYPRNSPPVW